jgi:hypothetical protein
MYIRHSYPLSQTRMIYDAFRTLLFQLDGSFQIEWSNFIVLTTKAIELIQITVAKSCGNQADLSRKVKIWMLDCELKLTLLVRKLRNSNVVSDLGSTLLGTSCQEVISICHFQISLSRTCPRHMHCFLINLHIYLAHVPSYLQVTVYKEWLNMLFVTIIIIIIKIIIMERIIKKIDGTTYPSNSLELNLSLSLNLKFLNNFIILVSLHMTCSLQLL